MKTVLWVFLIIMALFTCACMDALSKGFGSEDLRFWALVTSMTIYFIAAVICAVTPSTHEPRLSEMEETIEEAAK